MAIGQLGHSALQTVLAECDPSEADLEVLAVDEVFSYWRVLRRSMRMEQAFGISMFVTTFESFGGAFPMLSELSGYRRLMTELDEVLALPYHEAREGMERLETQARQGRWGILQATLYPALGGAATWAAKVEAMHRLDNLALAATAYRIKRGDAAELTVLVDTDTSKENVCRAATSRDWTVESVERDGSGFRIKIAAQ